MSIETALIICGIGCVVISAGHLTANSANEKFVSVHSELANAGSGFSNALTSGQPASRQTPGSAVEHTAELMSERALIVALLACTAGMLLVFFRKQSQRPADGEEEEVEDQSSKQPMKKRSVALTNVLGKRNEILARLEGSWEVIMDGHAVVSTYMSRELFSVDPKVSTESAFEQLNAKGFRRCMVTDAQGKLMGVVSKKDIVSKAGDYVQDVMTDKPRVATPDMEIHVALSILLENRISCLPVIDQGMLVGILSTSDLLMVLQCLLLELSILGKANGGQLSTAPVSKAPVNKAPVTSSVAVSQPIASAGQ